MVIDIEAIDILQQHEDIFNTTNNIIIYIARFFWYIIKFLQWIVAGLETALNQIFKNINMFNSPEMIKFTDSLTPITNALLVIGILILGYKLMTNTLTHRKNILINFIIIVIISTGFQTLLMQLSNITITATDTFMSMDGTNISSNLIKNNVYDLKYLDKEDFSKNSIEKKNNITASNIMKLDPVELMIPKNTENKDVFKNKLVMDTDGNISTKELGDGRVLGIGSDIFSEYYYRYKINWFDITSILIVMGIALFFTCIRVAELVYQLAITKTITPIIVVIDFSTGQRTKQILQKILYIFLTFISIALMFRVYYLAIDYIQNLDLPIIATLLLMAGASYGLINGPDIIQEMFGIDAGTSSSNIFHTTQIMSTISRSITSAPKNIGKALNKGSKKAGNLLSTTAKGVAGASGYANGRIQGLNEMKQNKENDIKQDNNSKDNLNKNNQNLNNLNKDKPINNTNKSDHSNLSNKINDDTLPNNLNDDNNLSSNLNDDKDLSNKLNDNTNNNLNDNTNNNLNDDKGLSNTLNNNTNSSNNLNNNNSSDIQNNKSNISDVPHNNSSKLSDKNIHHNDNLNIGNINSSTNTQNNNSYTNDKTTTLNDLVRQRFNNSTLNKNLTSIKNTYSKAKDIGFNTSLSKNNKKTSDKKGVKKHNGRN